jgi:hypothetical protein
MAVKTKRTDLIDPIFAPTPSESKSIQRAEGGSRVTKRWHTKIEGWMIDVAEKAILEGLPMARVAGLLGVSTRTLEKWRAEGQQPGCKDALKVELSVTIEEARAKAAQAGIQLMKMHAMKDWKAQLELLRAQDPQTWSPQSRQHIEIEMKTPERDLSQLSDEELAQLEALEAKMLKG